jgi:hypothetical protein
MIFFGTTIILTIVWPSVYFFTRSEESAIASSSSFVASTSASIVSLSLPFTETGYLTVESTSLAGSYVGQGS